MGSHPFPAQSILPVRSACATGSNDPTSVPYFSSIPTAQSGRPSTNLIAFHFCIANLIPITKLQYSGALRLRDDQKFASAWILEEGENVIWNSSELLLECRRRSIRNAV